MDKQLEDFKAAVWRYYGRRGRHDLPWRLPEPGGTFDPYKILVSEIMLQQTQVSRVIAKYQQFLEHFPAFSALAAAPLGEVLRVWSGLGYNRRAKFLWQAAERIVDEYHGQLPKTPAGLVKLPGIGPNTAGAVLAYSFNQPVVFVETNIRTVFIHHFFADRSAVSDSQILSLVEQTLPPKPREWYWALMDYGSHLKQTLGNLNKVSKHYTKQSRFQGSKRQIRGHILRLLGQRPYALAELEDLIADERLVQVLDDLTTEGLIVKAGPTYRLPSLLSD